MGAMQAHRPNKNVHCQKVGLKPSGLIEFYAFASLVSRIAQYSAYHVRINPVRFLAIMCYFVGPICVISCSLHDLLHEVVNNIIKSYVFHSSDENMRCNASFYLN